MIEIIEFKLINRGCLLSVVSIRLPKWGGFRIKNIKVFEKGDSRWMTLPSEEYEADGKTKYFPLVDFDSDNMAEAFRKAFFKAYDSYLEKLH